MKNEYKHELDSIQVSEQWKIEMKEKLQEDSLTQKRVNIKMVSLCLIIGCLLICIGVYYFQNFDMNSKSHIKNPYGTFGVDGILVKDVSDLMQDNPYDMNHPSSQMMVYRNLYRKDDAGIEYQSLSDQEKEKILLNYANKFNIQQYKIIKEGTQYILESDLCTMTLEQSTSLFIEFSENYLQTNLVDMNIETKEEGIVIIEKLYQKYKNIIDIEKPYIDVSFEYNIYSQKDWTFKVSEMFDNQDQSLFYLYEKSIEFCKTDEGQFYGLSIQGINASEMIKEYPIISLEEAKQKFMEGDFITTVEPFDSKQIGYVEMVYRRDVGGYYYMPYYHFYIFDDENEELQSYVSCYVLAIEEKYLQDLYS